MTPRLANLSEADRSVWRIASSFLSGRLAERATIDWALSLGSEEAAKRLALLHLIDGPEGQGLAEPWRSAWRLIEEYWGNTTSESDSSTEVYRLKRRVKAGDRSGALVGAIVALAAPRLRIEPFSEERIRAQPPPKRPKKIQDLFSVRVTSGTVIDPSDLDFQEVTDVAFLISLATALEASVANGLDIGRRIGWDDRSRIWALGQLHRVYYVPGPEREPGANEPDRFRRGIAPSVKLLHAVIVRLAELDRSAALSFVHRWKLLKSPIYTRLWAAMARDAQMATADEVGAFLTSLDDTSFWNIHSYPEIAELRAKRFRELGSQEQTALTARIRRLPPKNQWPKQATPDQVEDGRLYWAVRELRRLQLAGATLAQPEKAWLDSTITRFPDLAQTNRVDEGFLTGVKVTSVGEHPDTRYDTMAGVERLKALETALSAPGSWDDDPAQRAADWMRQATNPLRVLDDLESAPAGGADFPKVWDQFSRIHSPAAMQQQAPERNLTAEATRVLALLSVLPEGNLRQSIDGIAQWASTWKSQLVPIAGTVSTWLRLWPIAVEATNARQSAQEEMNIEAVLPATDDDSEAMDLDSLNTPAGNLIDVFLEACPPLSDDNPHPFESSDSLRQMRDTVIAAPERSGLIAQHRLMAWVGYFLDADRPWAEQHLLTALYAETVEALALWRAIARRTRFSELKIIGAAMSERTTDRRLDRETRQMLAFSLVLENLYAFKQRRAPAVTRPRMQQMIRALDDEVRAQAAEAVPRFVREVSSIPGNQEQVTPETLFRNAAAPFLQEVWPQERSLATPGVTRALVRLPAASRAAFADAVIVIERFLVPFDCWSMLDYGLLGEGGDEATLSLIDNHERAEALLRLLDLTVGTSVGSVVPYDLPDALDQVRKVAPGLVESQTFRRLATAARRI
jgi:hypothetical protein